ncbi:ribokinase [Luteimonas pelagia]
MGRVVVVGSFNIDHVWRVATLPAPGATLAGTYSTGPGGKGFNQAVAARRSGAATGFVCALGEDAGAQQARALCTADGIDLRALPADAPTGTAGIYVDAAGSNTIVIGAGANAALDAGFAVDALDAFDDVAVVLAQLESPPDAVVAVLTRAVARGMLAVLNPAPANAPVPDALLACVDVVTPNETELVALLSARGIADVAPQDVPAVDDARLHAWCRALLPGGTVVVTLGAAGCFVSHADDRRRGDRDEAYRVAAPRVRVVDTTGAGDAFSGALCSALARAPGTQFRRQVETATAYAARSTEAAGAALAMPWS